MIITFGQFTPDRPDQTSSARVASGVYPIADGYAPIPQLVAHVDTGSDRIFGGYVTKDGDGNTILFAATKTALLRMFNGAWVNVGASVFSLPENEFWSFEKFGNYVLATNGYDRIRYMDIATSATFDVLPGSPPVSRYMAVVRDQLLCGYCDNNPFLIAWSGFGDVESWEPTVNGSDFQVLPSGGRIMGVSGGEYGLVFQEFAIKRLTATGDSSTIYQIDEIESNHGLYVPGALAKYGRLNFYLSHNGFYICDGAGSRPIGDQRIDATFFSRLDKSHKSRIVSALDPIRKLVIWAYPTSSSVGGVPDRAVIYNWAIDRWSEASISLQYLMPAYTEGTSLDSMDSSFPSIDAMSISFDDDAFRGGDLLLAGFNANAEYCTFTGTPMAATLETGDYQPFDIRRARVRGFRVIGGPSTAQGQVGYKARSGDATSYTTSTTVNGNGYVDARCEGRLIRARVTTPSGASWSAIQGVEPDLEMSGNR